MKIRRWIVFGSTTFLLTAVGPPQQATAAPTVSGRASTVVEWFGVPGDKTALPVYQYLLLNVKDMDGTGLNFHGYGRLSTDLSNKVDADSHLYYGYLEKNDIAKTFDLKAGRQFVATTAGASMMDGVLLNFKQLGTVPVQLSLFGGGDVAYYRGYNIDDLVFGAKASTTLGNDLHLGISIVEKKSAEDFTHELLGFDADYDLKKLLNLYTELQYNNINEQISYFLGGVKYHRNPNWSVKGEYLYSLPVFSASSIYSVFATSQYEEALGEFSYKIATGLNTFLRYSHEIYDETANANVVEAGIEKIRTDKWTGYLSGVYRNDPDGQDLHGFKIHAAYQLRDNLQCGLGADLNVLERRIDLDADETTSQRYWADVEYAASKKISIQGKLERVTSQLWDDYYRGQVRLNVRF